MTIFRTLTFLAFFAIILSSCCARHSKAVRIHNLSGEPVFRQITQCQTEKIPRLGYEIFHIPNSSHNPYRTDSHYLSWHLNHPIKIRDTKGVLYRYNDFNIESYSGPTYKKWYDPSWSCIEKRYRAVLQPDMTIKFGSQIIAPEIGELNDDDSHR